MLKDREFFENTFFDGLNIFVYQNHPLAQGYAHRDYRLSAGTTSFVCSCLSKAQVFLRRPSIMGVFDLQWQGEQEDSIVRRLVICVYYFTRKTFFNFRGDSSAIPKNSLIGTLFKRNPGKLIDHTTNYNTIATKLLKT